MLPPRAPLGSSPPGTEIQRFVVGEYYVVPLYLNPFVHAVGPRVLPEGKAVERYWDTLHAPFPWPWEVWEVKG